MSATAVPTDVLRVDTGSANVFLYSATSPMAGDLATLEGFSGSRPDTIMQNLQGSRLDPTQVLKLDVFTRSPPVAGPIGGKLRVTAGGGSYRPHEVLRRLHHHLRTGRVKGFVVAKGHHPAIDRSPAQASGPAPAPSGADGSAAAGLAAAHPGAGAAAPHGGAAAPLTNAERIRILLADTLPLLGPDLRRVIESNLTPEALTGLVATFVAIGAAQLVPGAGEVLDAALLTLALTTVGFSGVKALWHLTQAVRTALAAPGAAQIAAAAPQAAEALVTLGTDFLQVALLRGSKSLRGMKIGGGGADAAAELADEAPKAEPPPRAAPPEGAPVRAAGDGAAAQAAQDGAGTNMGGAAAQSADEAEAVGHPVNPATGVVWTEQTDFALDGPLPLRFARIWLSSSTIRGELGHGWHHTLDLALSPRPGGRVAVRLADGRFVALAAPGPGRPVRDAVERVQLRYDRDADDGAAGGGIELLDDAGRIFRFGPLHGSSPGVPARRHLVAVADRNGNAITLGRDRFGGLDTIRDSAGRTLAVGRDALGRIATIAAPDPAGGDAPVALVAFDYDRDGDLVAARDPVGGTFRYAYERHLLVAEHRPAGLAFRFRWDDTGRRTRARCVATWSDTAMDGARLYDRMLRYDDRARCTTVTSARGAVERFEYDENDRVVGYTDALGSRRTRRFAPDGTLRSETRGDGLTRTIRRDGWGRVVEQVDFDGARRAYEYARPDADGVAHALPVTVTDATGATTRFAWDERLNLASHTDAVGRTRRFLRDARGLTLAITDALGPVRRLGWTADGVLAFEAAGDGSKRVEYRRDGLGRVVASGLAGAPPTAVERDAAGRVHTVRRATGGVVRLERDAEGRVTRLTNELGHSTRWRYDGLPFPLRRDDPDGTALEYRYDADLNLTGLINAKGEQYALDYDGADRLVREVGFDGRTRRYGYDAAGFLATLDDEDGRGARFVRDGAGRLLERRGHDGQAERYAYDARGALVSAANEWGVIEFAFDAVGSLVAETGPAGAIRHEHDARGRRVATVLPDGRRTEIAHDAADNVLAVGFDGREVASFTRDAAGREIGRRAGALTVVQERDPQGRLLRQSGRAGGGDAGAGAAAPVFERTYEWDAADRLLGTVDLARGVRRYHYDAVERLVGVDGDLPERFVWDPAGNIIGDGDGATGVATGDRLLFRGDRKFEYDGCGNRVREVRGAGGKVERLYRYDNGNQLREVEERSRLGRRVTSFRYDALGRRTEKRSAWWGTAAANDGGENRAPANDVNTTFTWTENVLLSELRREVDGADAYSPKVVYLHEPYSFRALAHIESAATPLPERVATYQLDHLGTPQELIDVFGRVVWRANLKVWGVDAQDSASAARQPIRFLGQYFDSETDLHYSKFRYYSPNEGTFINQDPIGLVGGPNPFAYPANPLRATDPLGLQPCFFGSAQRAEDKGFPGIGTTATGGPTFANSPYMFPAENGQDSNPTIALTGSRRADFAAANEAGGFTQTPEGYTWHHVDDFDPDTGTSSMELVQTDAHQATLPHKGSVGQYQDLFGIPYKP